MLSPSILYMEGIFMANDRHAGRKPQISSGQIEDAARRRNAGESVASIAKEYGISRQALNKHLKERKLPAQCRIDYMVDGELCSSLYYDRTTRAIRVENYASQLSKRMFGYKNAPDIGDLKDFFEDYYLKTRGIISRDQYLFLDEKDDIDINEALLGYSRKCAPDDVTDRGGLNLIVAEGNPETIPHFVFSKKDRVIRRTDTDGYQMKALSHDRRYFIKSQAVITGVVMRDWAVEVIASDICRQLSIPCIEQRRCRFVYEGMEFDGVYSDNFELDGYTFISFERLLERMGESSRDEEFIALGAIDKMKWCAQELCRAGVGAFSYGNALKYMLDLAVIDCLVGNVDRHTKNFGLFFCANTGRYMIAPAFDNGMGLFEHDPYRDRYHTFDEAMRNVYVAPYGEDPFEMIELLDKEFDLRKTYPGIDRITYRDDIATPFALEYERRIKSIWQK